MKILNPEGKPKKKVVQINKADKTAPQPTIAKTMQHVVNMQKANNDMVVSLIAEMNNKLKQVKGKPSKWEFTVQRDKLGYIKTVKAVAV